MEINNIDRSRYNVLMSRYQKFKEHMSDANKEVIPVFDPLPKQHVEELLLIREVTAELQKKLKEDLNKASTQAAAEIAAEKEKPIENAQPTGSE